PKGKGQAAYAAANMEMEQFSRHKNLLRLSVEARILADEYSISEAHLRHVVQLPEVDQAEMVYRILADNLTEKEVERLIINRDRSVQSSSMQAQRLVWVLRDRPEVQQVHALLSQSMDTQSALAYMDELRCMLDELREQLTRDTPLSGTKPESDGHNKAHN